ncbi:MAG: glycosyltransferase, partial [Patescibacteria group bacterium]
TIASGKKGYLSDFAKENKINFRLVKGLEKSSNPFNIIKFLFNFYRLLREIKPDVVHLNSSNALLGAFVSKIANMGVKNVFTVHGLSVLDENYKTSIVKKAIFKTIFYFGFFFVDDLVFVSQKNLDFALSQKIVKSAELIYNGVETNFLSREDARKFALNKAKIEDNDCFLIGSIGRLAYPKNYEFLIANFDKILEIKPNSKLIIIGEGPEREKYQKIAESFPGKIHFLGQIEGASQYLKALDLFVLPSIYEGLSLSLIEAYMSGIKIVASDVGGNSEVIGNENCYKLNEIADFINIFKKNIITEQKSCTDINKRNLDKARFSLDKMTEKYLKVYNS